MSSRYTTIDIIVGHVKYLRGQDASQLGNEAADHEVAARSIL